MAYTKTTWIGGAEGTEIIPARTRNLETQYDEVLAYWVTNPFRTLTSQPLVVEVAASAPAHGAGKIFVNSTNQELYVSDGSEWILLSEFTEVV